MKLATIRPEAAVPRLGHGLGRSLVVVCALWLNLSQSHSLRAEVGFRATIAITLES